MQHILVAVDGSPYTSVVADCLTQLPLDEQVTIEVLTVRDRSYRESGNQLPDWLGRYEFAESELADTAFEQIRRSIGSQVARVSRIDRSGAVGPAIVEAAAEQIIDLVVVGAKGRSAIARKLLGSVSDYVATHATTSVLVVRPDQQFQFPPIRHVTVCYDDSPPAQAALRQLTAYQWTVETEFDLLYISEFIEGFSKRNEPYHQQTAAIKQQLRRSADQQSQGGRSVRSCFLTDERAGEGIVRFLKNNRTELVVVGETSRHPSQRMVLGSVSRYVLRHASCSIWIARDQGRSQILS